MFSENNDCNQSSINDVNVIFLNDELVDNVVPSDNIDDSKENSIQLDEFKDYDLYLDDLLKKHMIGEKRKDSSEEVQRNSTHNDEESIQEETISSKFDNLTAEFSTFKIQVIKEFLFLKLLIKSSKI